MTSKHFGSKAVIRLKVTHALAIRYPELDSQHSFPIQLREAPSFKTSWFMENLSNYLVQAAEYLLVSSWKPPSK